MLVLVTLIIASLGSLMIGSATSSHETSRKSLPSNSLHRCVTPYASRCY